MDLKNNACDFLVGLENRLRTQLPPPAAMKALMSKLSKEGSGPSKIRENIFLYHILPIVDEHVQTIPGIHAEESRSSMLCEYHSKVPDIASGNPFRRVGHPFNKKLGASIDDIMQTWTKPLGGLPLNQAYPDFCLRAPFPYEILFDAKYFTQNSPAAAKAALVEGAYEVMFYRGLPSVSARLPNDPGWKYEFGCLLAYDASDQGILKKTWASVTRKNLFWDGGNIFVMII
jgi:hypothetical protein